MKSWRAVLEKRLSLTQLVLQRLLQFKPKQQLSQRKRAKMAKRLEMNRVMAQQTKGKKLPQTWKKVKVKVN